MRQYLILFCLALATVSNFKLVNSELQIETYTFLASCKANVSIDYDFKSPVEILNHEYQWNSSLINSCSLNINIKNDKNSNKDSSTINSFIVIFNMNLSKCDDSYKLIMDIIDSSVEAQNKLLINQINLCERFKNVTNKNDHYLLINSASSFIIKLNEPNNNNIGSSSSSSSSANDVNNSYPFKLIESITITSYSNASKGMFVFIYLFSYSLGI